MCTVAFVPPCLEIDASATDEEVILFLGGRTAEDPIPSNMITDVNPFSIEPWDSPALMALSLLFKEAVKEGMWYLYNSEDGQLFNRKNIFKETKLGYWRSMDHIPITADNVTTGRKTTWEFYIGQEPLGKRTGWMMYDYHKAQKNFSSICRVFLQDVKLLDSALLRLLEEEAGCSPSHDANQSEAVAENEQIGAYEPRQLEFSNRSLDDGDATGYSTEELNAQFEISRGEYLKLDDFYDLESTSSSSDNSSLTSSNSDDCFDAEALLRDIEKESNGIMQDEVMSSKRNLTTVKPSPVEIRPYSADSPKSFNGDEEGLPASMPPSNCSFSKASSPQFDATTSAYGSRLRGHPKRTHSGCSESSSGSSATGSKSVRRIAKLGKKYCCLTPF